MLKKVGLETAEKFTTEISKGNVATRGLAQAILHDPKS